MAVPWQVPGSGGCSFATLPRKRAAPAGMPSTNKHFEHRAAHGTMMGGFFSDKLV